MNEEISKSFILNKILPNNQYVNEVTNEIKINEKNYDLIWKWKEIDEEDEKNHGSEINGKKHLKNHKVLINKNRILSNNMDKVINVKKNNEVKHASRIGNSGKTNDKSIENGFNRYHVGSKNSYTENKMKIQDKLKMKATTSTTKTSTITNTHIIQNDINIPKIVHTTVRGDCQSFWIYREWWSRLGYETKCYNLMEQLAILEEFGLVFKSSGSGVSTIVKRRNLKAKIMINNNNNNNNKDNNKERDTIQVLDVQISDVSRFLILYKYGGIYVDSDVKPNIRWAKQLSTFIDPKYEVIIGYEANMVSNFDKTTYSGVLPRSICMWTFLSKPGSKVMLTIARGLYKRIKPKREGQSLDKYVHWTTGPSAVTKIIENNYPKLQIAPVTLFGCGQKHSSAGNCGTPKNFVQHHFRGTWRKMPTASSYFKPNVII